MSDVSADLLRAGRLHEAEGRRDEAIESYQRAILANPDDPACYVHLGELLYTSGFVPEARGVYDIGLRRLPASPILNWVRCMVSLPLVAADMAEIEAARAAFTERLDGLRAICFANDAALREAERAVGLRSPSNLAGLGEFDPALMVRHGALVADIMAARHPARAVAPRVPWHPEEKIRIGVVFGLFWRHPAWRMPVRGWLTHLDRSRFTVIGYHTRNERDDQTAAAERLCDRFHSGWAPVPVWLNRIEADAPHVLLYPELGVDQTALQLAALRLAPVQCTTWGQPVTSGLPTIGHYLSGALLEPPEAERWYAERLVRLPGLGTVLERGAASWGDPLPDGDPWAGFDLPEHATRILCPEPAETYLPRYDEVFPRIARALPTARFVFVARNDRGRDTLWRRLALAFHANGLSGEAHCLFVTVRGDGELSALVRDAHIHVDPIGWSGRDTVLDALSQGVPCVTLPGDTMRARFGLALLETAGVTDTVVGSVDALVDEVVRLGSDPLYRRAVSVRLLAGRDRLFGDPAPVRALETFLTTEVARRGADA